MSYGSFELERDLAGESRELERERDEMDYRGAMMEDRLTARIDEYDLQARMLEKEMSVWRNRAERAEAMVERLFKLAEDAKALPIGEAISWYARENALVAEWEETK